MIYQCFKDDAAIIYVIINEAARAYDGFIPADCYHQPYMPWSELTAEMERVVFFGWKVDRELIGVMGMEPVKDVTLIRHAYILPQWQQQGTGRRLLEHIKSRVDTPRLLVGTWAGATWAIDFYLKHGFTLLPDKDKLLAEYWDIPRRQIETSVVMGMEIGRDQKEPL